MRLDFGLPPQVRRVFWGITAIEAAFGVYLGIWPLWIERLGAPIAIVGIVLGSSGILRLFVLAPSASLVERLGIRRVLLIARICATVGLASAALATHWTHLAPMIIGSAIGELAFPVAQTHVAAHAGDQRIRAFALVFTVGPSVALAVSPLLAGALVALWGMRAAFAMAAILTAASVAIFAGLSSDANQQVDHTAVRTGYRETLADRGVRRIVALLFASVFSLALGTSFIPNFLEDARGLDPSLIATLGGAAAVGSALFGLAVGRYRRLQQRPLFGVAAAVGLTGIGFVLLRQFTPIGIITLAFVLRGGLFSTWALLSAAMGNVASERQRSRAFALCEMAGGLGFSIAPMIAGPLFERRATLPFEISILLAAVMVPTILFAQRRTTHPRRRIASPAARTP